MESPRERQFAEIEALQAIYGDALTARGDPVVARLLIEGAAAVAPFVDDDAALSFTIRIEGGCGHGLSIALPPAYPAAPATVSIVPAASPSASSIAVPASLNPALRRAAEAAAAEDGNGQEVIFDLCCLAAEQLEQARAHAQAQAEAEAEAGVGSLGSAPPRAGAAAAGASEEAGGWMRVFFWAHHIRRKQVDMLELAAELGLSGLIMMGRPGYIFCEGARSAMEAAIKRVKSWHWREVRVNWQEIVPPRGGAEREGDGGAEAAPRLLPVRTPGVEMEIVERAVFMAAFRAVGRLDILECGTGVRMKA